MPLTMNLLSNLNEDYEVIVLAMYIAGSQSISKIMALGLEYNLWMVALW
jgi:hypothetical protein